MLGLVGSAFFLAGAEAALVGRRRKPDLRRGLGRALTYAAYVSVLFGLLFADAIGGCIRVPFYFYAGPVMIPGGPLALTGYAATSWALRK